MRNVNDNVTWIDEPIDRPLLQEVLDILRPIHNVAWPQGRPGEQLISRTDSKALRIFEIELGSLCAVA